MKPFYSLILIAFASGFSSIRAHAVNELEHGTRHVPRSTYSTLSKRGNLLSGSTSAEERAAKEARKAAKAVEKQARKAAKEALYAAARQAKADKDYLDLYNRIFEASGHQTYTTYQELLNHLSRPHVYDTVNRLWAHAGLGIRPFFRNHEAPPSMEQLRDLASKEAARASSSGTR